MRSVSRKEAPRSRGNFAQLLREKRHKAMLHRCFLGGVQVCDGASDLDVSFSH